MVREMVNAGEVRLVKVDTHDQLADMLTKGLGRIKHGQMRDRIMHAIVGHAKQGEC